MTAVKICGLMRTEDAICVSACRADYAGLMCYSKSKRYVPPEEALVIRNALAKEVKAVGVFVNADTEELLRTAKALRLDYIQLHGEETEETIRTVQRLTSLPVIKAFRVENTEDVKRAVSSCADEILLDHGAGGTGEVFDWSLLADCGRDFFLAGGLHPGNVKEAVASLHPKAIDVSSGVETDGKKDAEKIETFINMVRSTEHE